MPKISAKPQPPGQEPPRRRSLLPYIGVGVLLALVVGYTVYQRSATRGDADQAAASSAAPTSAPTATSVQPATGPLKLPDATAAEEVPAAAKFGPHKQQTYPPLPETGYPPPRPAETVRAVYQFAAEHPEVLGYIPCYCGCDRQGHKGNDDCFVAQRNAQGDVQAWDAHGMT